MIGFGSRPSADARNISIGETYPGLSDNDGYALEDPAYHARMARTRDPRIREQTLLIDQGRCVISSHQVVFRGRAIGVEVVHLWPLGLDGRDDVSNTAVMHVALHQLYDRFVFTLSDEFEIIWAPDADLDVLTRGLHIGKRAHFLRAPTQMPDLMNLRWHRERFFQLQQSFGFAI